MAEKGELQIGTQGNDCVIRLRTEDDVLIELAIPFEAMGDVLKGLEEAMHYIALSKGEKRPDA